MRYDTIHALGSLVSDISILGWQHNPSSGKRGAGIRNAYRTAAFETRTNDKRLSALLGVIREYTGAYEGGISGKPFYGVDHVLAHHVHLVPLPSNITLFSDDVAHEYAVHILFPRAEFSRTGVLEHDVLVYASKPHNRPILSSVASTVEHSLLCEARRRRVS